MKILILFLSGFLSMGLMAATKSTRPIPSDPQIAMIVVTADQVDIDAGKLAQTKTQNTQVKQFAEQMVTDHTAVNKQATDLAGKLKIVPEESTTSQDLKMSGKTTMEKLKNLSGKQFDKAYIDNEVKYHQTVLDTIDKVLIPSAQNQDLKDLVIKVRPAIASHLEHAKHLQKSLK